MCLFKSIFNDIQNVYGRLLGLLSVRPTEKQGNGTSPIIYKDLSPIIK